MSQHSREIYGFDSFEGLEEEWNMNDYNPIGRFSLNKKNPKVLKNVTLIKGKVQSTLENFLKDKKDKKIIFVHMDMDTYIPTKYALNKIKLSTGFSQRFASPLVFADTYSSSAFGRLAGHLPKKVPFESWYSLK